jgi:hypothetical protein
MMQMQPGSPGLDRGNQGQENVLMISPNKQSMHEQRREMDRRTHLLHATPHFSFHCFSFRSPLAR